MALASSVSSQLQDWNHIFSLPCECDSKVTIKTNAGVCLVDLCTKVRLRRPYIHHRIKSKFQVTTMSNINQAFGGKIYFVPESKFKL